MLLRYQHVIAFRFKLTMIVNIHTNWSLECWPLTWSVSSRRQRCRLCLAAPAGWRCWAVCSFPSSVPASARCRCRSAAPAAAAALRTAGQRQEGWNDPITAGGKYSAIHKYGIHNFYTFHILSCFDQKHQWNSVLISRPTQRSAE